MFKQNEQVKIETQKAIDTAMDLVTASIHSVEKLTHIQLETSRQILEDTTKALKELTAVTDAKEILSRVSEMATHAVEKNMASARDIYDVVNEVNAKINKIAETNLQVAQQSALNSVDGFANKFNTSGSQAASNSVKTWIDSTNQAISAVSKVASQVTEFANNNISAATTATVNAVKKAVNK